MNQQQSEFNFNNDKSQANDLIKYAVANNALVSVWCHDEWQLSRCDNIELIMDCINQLDGIITLIFINNRYGHTGHIGSAVICSTNKMVLEHTDNTWFDEWELTHK